MSHFGGIIRFINGNFTINGDLDLLNHNINNVNLFEGRDISGLYDTTKAPSGFPNRVDSFFALNVPARTLWIIPSAVSYDVYVHGYKYTKNAPEFVTWANTEGTWFFYFDLNGVIRATQDPNVVQSVILGDGASFATLYWNAATGAVITLGDERHDFMPGTTHLYLHECFGAQWFSGGALGGITSDDPVPTDAGAVCTVSNTVFYDEDIRFDIIDGSPQVLSPFAKIPVYYLSGGAADWRKVTADNFPFIYSGKTDSGYVGAAGRVPYNQWTGAAWQLTEVGEGKFVLAHIFATNDFDEPIVCIQGQNEYATIGDARTGAETEINTLAGTIRLLTREGTALGTLILQTSAGYGNTPKARIRKTAEGGDYIDFRGNPIIGSGAAVGNHSNLASLSNDDHCFSADTELLTDRGFIYYQDIKEDENVLTFNMDNDQLEYQQIQGKYVYNNFDELISFKNRYGEILVTPNHTMVYKNQCRPDKNHPNKHPKTKWLTCTAEEATNRFSISIPINGILSGEELDISDDMLELLGLIISEGHFYKKYDAVKINQKAGPQADYIENLLIKVGADYTNHYFDYSDDNGNEHQMKMFYIKTEWAHNNIRNWIDDKRISEKLMKLRGHQFLVFLSALILGDGSVWSPTIKSDKISACKRLVDNFDGKIKYSYHSGDSELVEQLTQLCTFNGLRAYPYFRPNTGFKNGCWTISITNKQEVYFGKENKKRVLYSGDVWCVSVPNKTLVLRRNGFIFIAGNTQYILRETAATVTDRAIATWDGTTGRNLQNTLITINNNNDVIWNTAVAAPTLYQADSTVAGGFGLIDGHDLVVHAQDVLQANNMFANIGGNLDVRAGNADNPGMGASSTGGNLTLASGFGVVSGYGYLNAGVATQLLWTTNTILFYSPNVYWDAGVAVPALYQGSKPAVGAGAEMFIFAQEAAFVGAGNNIGGALTVRAGNASGAAGFNNGGILKLKSGSGTSNDGAIEIYTGSNLRLTLTTTGNELIWEAGLASVLYDQADMAGTGTAANMAFTAQNSFAPGGVNRGGAITVQAGAAQNNGGSAATGGTATLQGAAATQTAGGAVTTTGGDAQVIAGSAAGSGATGPVVGGSLILQAGTALGGSTNTNGSVGVWVGATELYKSFIDTTAGNSHSLQFTKTSTSPVISQESSAVVGTGALFTIHAQDSQFAGAGAANIGGAFTGRAGNASLSTNAAGNTGGALTWTGGDATGAGTDSFAVSGGAFTGRAGDANISADGGAPVTGGSTVLRGGRGLGFNAAAVAGSLSGGSITVSGGAAGRNVDTGVYYRGALALGGSVTVNGGDAYGQTAKACTSGAATIRSGHAVSLGGAGSTTMASDITVQGGDATAGAGGALSTAVAGHLVLKGGTASGAATNTSGNIYLGSTNVAYQASVATPNFYQVARGTVGTGQLFTISAQDSQTAGAGSANTGGELYGRGGRASLSTHVSGNIGGAITWAGGNATGDATHLATGGGATLRSGDANISADGAVTCTGGSTFVRGGRGLGFADVSTQGVLVGGPVTVAGGMAGYDGTTYYRGASAQGGSVTVQGGDAYGQTLLACTSGAATIRSGNAVSLGGAASTTTASDITVTGGDATAGAAGVGSTTIAGHLILKGGTGSGAATNTNGNVYLGSTNVVYQASVLTPTFYQADKVTVGVAAAMSIHAQNVASVFAATGGDLTVYAGDNTCTGGIEAGGAATFRGGDIVSGTAFTVSGTGGAVTLRGGNVTNAPATLAAVGGIVTVQGGSATSVGGAGSTTVGGDLILAGGTATGGVASNTPGKVLFGSNNFAWQATVATPTLYQLDSTVVAGGGIVGYPMLYHAQDVLQANAGFLNTGSLLTVRGGNATNAGTGGATGGNYALSGGTALCGGGAGSVAVGGHVILAGGGASGGAVSNTIGEIQFATAVVAFQTAVATPTLRQDARTTVGVGITFTVRAQDATAVGAGTNTGGILTVSGGNASGAVTANNGGELNLTGGSGGTAATAGAVNLQTGGVTRLTMTNANVLQWVAAAPAPVWTHADLAAFGAAGTMTLHAQDSLVTGGANTGGALTQRAGNATANLTNNATGGAASLSGGTALCGGGAGSIAVGGHVILAGGGASGGAVSNTIGEIQFATATVAYQTGVALPMFRQDDKTTAGSGALLTVHAQNVTGVNTSIGGALTLYAGDNSCANGAVAQAGGAATFRGGDVSGAVGTNTGGATTVRGGNAAGGGTNTGGDLNLSSGIGATATGALNLQTGGSSQVVVTSNLVTMNATTLYWAATTATPIIKQADIAGVGTTGQAFLIAAQNNSGTGAAFGASMTVRAGAVTGAGTTTTGGAFTSNGGDVSGAFTVTGIGGAAICRGGNAGSVGTPLAAVLPSIAGAGTLQGGDAWSTGTAGAYTVTGGKGVLRGGNVTFSAAGAGTIAQGGHVLIQGGVATGAATNYSGNVAFHSDPASWQAMCKGLFVGECTQVPTGLPVAGGYLYVEGGALKYMGPSGAITWVGAA
jgi:hypothetical protein